MLENVKWLFFDIGSTLVDEQLAYVHRASDIAAAAGVPHERVLSMMTDFYKQNIRGDLETAEHLHVDLPKWHAEDERVYADAPQVLAYLSRKYKIGIIANQAPGTAERLKQYGLLPYIDLIVASAEEKIAKPDRRIFEIALERADCKPQDTVMIGDRIDNDIVPANLLGMTTIWIRQGFGKDWNVTRDAEKADYVIDRLHSLQQIL